MDKIYYISYVTILRLIGKKLILKAVCNALNLNKEIYIN